MIRSIFFFSVLPIIFSIEVISSTTSDKPALIGNSDPSVNFDNKDIDKKEDRQFVKERQDAEAIISATHQLEESPPSPQFHADETLYVEASIRNNLFHSQSIQHKIIPLNNNRTEVYTNQYDHPLRKLITNTLDYPAYS